ATACRLIEQSEELPSLGQLARAVAMSPSHFHRLFKATTGLTPKAYSLGQRARRVKLALPKNSTVTNAIYEAGYNSNSRFYTDATKMLGMKPSAFRDGGRDNLIRFGIGKCSLGSLLVAVSATGVCAIFLGDNPDQLASNLQARFPKAKILAGDAGFEKLVTHVARFVDAPNRGLALPLDIRGTIFQQRVWQELQKIPLGKTIPYAELAQRLGSPQSTRAVAQACGANPLAIAIPCHRVVRSDGGISGYRWGIARKKQLLAWEKSHV
ncbi:MAG TPA: methylated-DNA--[protein]-cysteine S-methyltransferase, partial [Verrucomicrobiae bacterium]